MKLIRRFGMIGGAAVTVAMVAWLLLPAPPPLFDGVSYSREVRDAKGRLLHVTLTSDQKYRIKSRLNEVSPSLIEATLSYEDRHFWQHPGINPVSAARSTWHFCRTHAAYGGASTISMQLARLRYRMNSKTIAGKLVQMVRALQIERHYSKDQILEAYLNFAPYGRNIEGVRAGSLLYFGKEPAQLTMHEAIALSVIPQSPYRRTPRADRPNQALISAEMRLLARMKGRKEFNDREPRGVSDDADDFTPRIEAKRATTAPHFVRCVLAEPSAQGEIRSTLDLDRQRMIERRITAYLEVNRRLGLRNAAAMLVDCRTMGVLAQVGSASFFDDKIGGQVDGTRSRRSPGSTLKPFIYALGLEQGIIQPLSIVKDAPRRFGDYSPENFDGEFAGPISATDALVRSRNLPAVWLASELSHPSLYDWLKRGGVQLPHEESYYGLALPLGDGEVTMEELVRLYAALANDGRLRPLRRTLPSPEGERGSRLLSPEAAFLTLDMLSHNPRPGLSDTAGDEGVCWKTGTSHGFRDAWSIGVFDHYVLAVWIGNFDGQRNPAFIGRTCAGPLFFQIVDAMRAEGRAHLGPRQPPAGANLQRVELCAVSGQIPIAVCTHRVTGWFIPGISPIMSCEVHRVILVDVDSGLRVPVDDGTHRIRREVYEFWPSDLMALFEKSGLPRRRPPPFLPETQGSIEAAARGGKAPKILSPQSGRIYALGNSTDEGSGISLKAQTDGDVARIYWFANRAFLGTSSADAVVSWKPSPGTYRVVALDDHGRTAASVAVIQPMAAVVP